MTEKQQHAMWQNPRLVNAVEELRNASAEANYALGRVDTKTERDNVIRMLKRAEEAAKRAQQVFREQGFY